MESEGIQSLTPFKLIVTVHYANNLAIADILSSDPYVVVNVDDKFVGKTKTIYQNHLNPSWEHEFQFPLLHLKHILRLKVFDEDSNKHDDFMGLTMVDLQSIGVGESVPFDSKLRDSENACDTKGTLRYTVKIEQCQGIVKVVPAERGEHADISNESTEEVVSIIESELKSMGIDDSSDPVRAAILESPIVANHTTMFSRMLVRDLLHDVFSLNTPAARDDETENIYPGRERTCVQAVSSTVMDLGSHKCCKAAPISTFGVHILCYSSAWDTIPDKCVELNFTNRYATWIWAMYLRLAVEYWRGLLQVDDLPTFVHDSSLVLQTSTPATLVVNKKQSYTGILVLRLQSKFKIACEHVDTREVLALEDVSALRDLRLSIDTSPPKSHALVIKNISLRLSKKMARQSSDSSISLKSFSEEAQSETTPDNSKKRFPILRKVSKFTRNLGSAVIGGASAATEVVTDTAKDAAKFATSSAASAVRTIASADAVGALTTVKDVGVTVGSSVLGAGSTVVNTVSNIGHGTFLQPMVHLAVRAGEKIVALDSRPAADEVEWRDLQLDFDVDESDINGEESHGLELLLYKGQTGAEVPVACKFVPFLQLNKKLDSGRGRLPVRLNGLLGLRVTLKFAENIPTLPVFNQAAYYVYASIKCVRWNGEGRGIKYPSIKSKPVPASGKLAWDEDLVLLAEHGIEWAQYVRIELFHGHILAAQKQSLGSTSLGAAYIPFEDFTNCRITKTLQLYQRGSADLVQGEVKVAFRRIQDEHDDFSPKATIDYVLEEDDTSCWSAQAILAGGAEDKQTPQEDFSVCPSFLGLRLSHFGGGGNEVENATLETVEVEEGKDLAHNSSRLASTDFCLTPRSASLELAQQGNGTGVMEVFENERRSVRPPFSFGPGNLFIHPHFSDSAGKPQPAFNVDKLEDIRPPVGCEWTGPWTVDQTHTKTDEEGWSYAISYDYLISNCQSNSSHATAKTRASRRRKHTRPFRVSNAASTASNSPRQQESDIAIGSSPRFKRVSSFLESTTGAVTGVASGAAGVVTGAAGVVSDAVGHINPFRSDIPIGGLSRGELFHVHPELVVALCKERSMMNDDVATIPWPQVVTVEAVSEATLFIRVRLHRYFGQNAAGDDIFHLADVDIFVLNCPAFHIKTLCAERMALYTIRKDVHRVIAVGNVDADKEQEDCFDSEAVPATLDLSVGSHVAAQLDVELQTLASQLVTIQANPTELAAAQFRQCRLRLYVASLLRGNIKGRHDFSDNATAAIISRDFDAARRIVHDNEVATASNRIEYLLDAAETHLRDAALCGWSHRIDGRLQAFIEKITNSYLIEMVALLGRFFDGNQTIRQVKGLNSKTQLIVSFMRHNDRLGQLLDSALRPYGLTTKPRPQLQLFLRLDTLVAWYSSALQQEMCLRVDNVLLTWKTFSAGGDRSRYKFSLPWIPLREAGDSGLFISQIPEDVRQALVTYLLYARLRDDEAAIGFGDVMDRFDERVGVLYVQAVLHLIDCYEATLDSCQWGVEPPELRSNSSSKSLPPPPSPTSASSDNSSKLGSPPPPDGLNDSVAALMQERLEYLSSVANDLRRIDQSMLLIRDGPLKSIFTRDAVIAASAAASTRLTRLNVKVCDHISSVLMRIICTAPIWLNAAAHLVWLKSNTESAADGSDALDSFAAQMTDVGDLLDSVLDYLTPFSMYCVLCNCVYRVVARYLHMLRIAEESGRVIGPSSHEMRNLLEASESVRSVFTSLTQHPQIQPYADSILGPVRCMDQALALAVFDREAPDFSGTLQSIVKISQSHPQSAPAFAKFVETCVNLRSDSPRTKALSNTNTTRRRSSVLGSMGSVLSTFTGTQNQSPHTPPATADQDPAIAAVLEEILDSYDPTEFEGAAGTGAAHPVVAAFSSASNFSLAGLLFGGSDTTAQQPRTLMGSLGSVLSFMNSSPVASTAVSGPVHVAASRSVVRVKALSCSGLLCLAGKPKAYLSMNVDGVFTKTSVQDGVSPSWSEELNFEVTDLGTRRVGLQVSLFYLGRIYGDECVASLNIDLNALAISGIEGEVYPFETFRSPKAQAAAERARLLGNEMPSLKISLSVVS